RGREIRVKAPAKMRFWVAGLLLIGLPVFAAPFSDGYSAAGLYNLGNSYARAGKPGMAVLNYERARLLAPDDADVEANLQFVRSSAHLPAESRTRFERFATAASPFVLAWVGLAGLIVVGAC